MCYLVRGHVQKSCEAVIQMFLLDVESVFPGHRIRITDDNMISAVDVTRAVTGKDANEAAECIRELREEIFSANNFEVRSLPGRGNGRTKLVSVDNAITLIMVLPGEVARENRVKFAGIIRRYHAGDKTMIKEIEDNADSIAPVNRLARGESVAGVSTSNVILDTLELRKASKELGVYNTTVVATTGNLKALTVELKTKNEAAAIGFSDEKSYLAAKEHFFERDIEYREKIFKLKVRDDKYESNKKRRLEASVPEQTGVPVPIAGVPVSSGAFKTVKQLAEKYPDLTKNIKPQDMNKILCQVGRKLSPLACPAQVVENRQAVNQYPDNDQINELFQKHFQDHRRKILGLTQASTLNSYFTKTTIATTTTVSTD